MTRIAILGCSAALAGSLLLSAGCSSSTTSEPTEKINGMNPAEYREKAEISREIQPGGPKTGGPARRR